MAKKSLHYVKDRFEVTEKKAVIVLPTSIIRGLMQAEDMVFTKKYKEIREPKIRISNTGVLIIITL